MSDSNDRASWLCGSNATCSHQLSETQRGWRLILLGAPGIGKGTLAELLNKKLGSCPLSTGDVFRHALKNREEASPAMQEALRQMKRGALVSDETVISMVAEREACLRCPGGFLLDGFPRTLDQAKTLKELMDAKGSTVDAVLSLELPIDRVIERLDGRRVCRDCGRTYHLRHSPPHSENSCDSCGGVLFQREDDHPDVIRLRMEIYEESATPLKSFYEELGLLRIIKAEGSPVEILERTLEAIGHEKNLTSFN